MSETALPNAVVTFHLGPTQTGLLPVLGLQIREKFTQLVKVARTQANIAELPAGTGNYYCTIAVPAEPGTYQVIWDRSNGVLNDQDTAIEDLEVSAVVEPGSSGLGAVGDYVKMRLGGQTWKSLTTSDDFGESFVVRAIEIVKRRAMNDPPATADEATLDPLVLDYLGIIGALELIPAARDYWMNQLISESVGDDPTEMTTYVNRAEMMDKLRDDLMRRLPAAQALAIPLMTSPRLVAVGDGPDIDEIDDFRTTSDPRDFPAAADFPVGAGSSSEPIPLYRWSSLG